MQSKRLVTIMFVAIAGALCIMAMPRAAEAWSCPSGTTCEFSKDTCDVTNSDWLMYPSSDGLTLPRALYHASKAGDRDLEHCLQQINIKVKKIMLLSQVYIKGDGTGENDRFVLEGVSDATDKLAILDATNIESSGTAPTEKCVVRVVGQYVTLKNIRIANVPSGWNAICVEKQNIDLDAVQVNDGGGDGIYFNTTSGSPINGVVRATSSINGMGGYAINFGKLGSETFNLNKIEPVSTGVTIGSTDSYGLIKIADADRPQFVTEDGKQVFKRGKVLSIASSDVSRFFQSESPIQACIKSKIYDQTTGKVRIRGFVVNYKGTITSTLTHTDAPIDTKTRRLQVYDKVGFWGFVGPQNTTTKYGMGPSQAMADNTSVGWTGSFDFAMDQTVGKIVLVPEESDGKIGRASRIIDVSAGGTSESFPCSSWELGDDTTSSSSGSVTGGGIIFKGFTSVADCVSKRATQFGGGIPSYYDSDGDGVYDDDEDKDKDCKCDSKANGDTTDESCWYKFDTDDDGIPDGAGKETISATVMDSDGIPNVLDDDSDDDGIKDGMEDRNQFFTRKVGIGETDGLLYRYDSIFGLIPVQSTKADSTGAYPTNKCDLSTNKDLGVRYGWYAVTCADSKCISFSSDPQEINGNVFQAQSSKTSGQYVAVLICRNKSLVSPANFNGSWNQGNMELDPWDVDTDNDLWCDGAKCGLSTSYKPNDKCPLVTDKANTCTQKAPCYTDSIYYSVLPEFVKFTSGLPSSFVDDINWSAEKKADNIPDFLQKGYKSSDPATTRASIETNCPGDMDDDGIPDCVENPKGTCPASQGGEKPSPSDPTSQKLKHYSSDSDGDGLTDGWKGGALGDVCPESYGQLDGFSETKSTSSYSCDPAKVYTTVYQGLLACFLDRDGDGLRDCEEDKNYDGKQDYVVGVTGIATTETNPLSGDTDSDKVSDLLELKGWPTIKTNAADPDTDADGLKDGEEDRDKDGKITVTLLEGQGCSASLGKDTDPTRSDTDADGLSDKMETAGSVYTDDIFRSMIQDATIWSKGGIHVYSSPLAKDSDGDGLTDDKEYNGSVITYTDSNPCMTDSDGDGLKDSDTNENTGACRLSKDSTCATYTAKYGTTGIDTDNDGLVDLIEASLGTDPKNKDTDGDELLDGQEDANHNGIYESTLGETDPLDTDTDEDGLTDGTELRTGGNNTDPTIADTDSDCILDGLEDANHDGKWQSNETNPYSSDTDGDSLPDGKIQGIGEDMNCNGKRDADSSGSFLETDPTNRDSDWDGNDDRSEMFSGGQFSLANVGLATRGESGCQLVAGSAATPSSVLSLVIMLAAAAVISIRRKIKEQLIANS